MRAIRHPLPPGTILQRPVLLRNMYKPGMKPFEVRFKELSDKDINEAGPYFQIPHLGRGLAVGDFDNDGHLDVVFNNLNEPASVLRNTVSNGNHWIGVQLVGNPNRDAVGAEVVLEVNGRRLIRQVKGGGSYLSASDRRIVFGLGECTKADKLTVKWPYGKTQTWEGADLSLDKYSRLLEGEPKPQPFPGPPPK